MGSFPLGLARALDPDLRSNKGARRGWAGVTKEVEMGEAKSTLIGLLPPALVRHYNDDFAPPKTPQVDVLRGAVLFLDISGFTTLTESLAEQGALGIEQLTVILNEHFGKLIRLVSDSSGEVCAFAGDAFAAIWPCGISGESLQEVCLRAAGCALAMQELRSLLEQRHQTKLDFKIGVGVGNIDMSHLGGVAEHWVLLFKGSGILDAIEAQERAQPGDCILSPEVIELIRGECSTEKQGHGFGKLKSLSHEPELHLAEALTVSDESQQALQCYLARTVLSRFAAGQADWLGELRRISVMFLNLPDISPSTDLSGQQEIFKPVQEVITKFGGTVNKLSIDEKGVSVLAVMGLPPNVYVDSSIRMVRASLALLEVFRARNFRASIGVTTGKAFCGVIGSRIRREYTVMGDVVNVAARLMAAAKGGLLCDLNTRNAGREVIQFDALPRIKLKGKAQPVAIFRPQKEIVKHQQKTALRTVGRKREQLFLKRRLKAVSGGGTGGVFALEGAAGVGKSHLCALIIEFSAELGLIHFRTFASVVEESTPFFSFRYLLESLLGFSGGSRTQGKQLWAALLKEPEFSKSAPVLNDIFETGLKENDITRQLAGAVRREYIGRLVTMVLSKALGKSGRGVMVFEDSHWMDSASWSLLSTLARKLPRLLVFLSTRNIQAPGSRACLDFWRTQKAKRVRISKFDREETRALIAQTLGISVVADNVVEFVYKNTSGNPFYVQEFSYALRDGRYIDLDKGQAASSLDSEALAKLSFPDSIQGIVSARIDRLPPEHQMTLKVASVIGRVFSVEVIENIHPMEQDRPLVARYLEYLVDMGFLRFYGDDDGPAYIFSHAITQEVAYELMLYDQRRTLHKGIAQWYESKANPLEATHFSVLAHHWMEAGEVLEATRYLEKAGDLAYSTGAFLEASRNFERAMDLTADKILGERASVVRLRRARWSRKLADSFYGLGSLDQALNCARQSLALLGKKLPTTVLGWKISIAASRLVSRRYKGALPQFGKFARKKDELIEASHAARRYAECSYRNQDYDSMMGASWLAVRYGEKAGGYAEISLSYAMLGMGYGVHGKEQAANTLFEVAKKIGVQNSRPIDFVFTVQNMAIFRIGFANWRGLQEILSEASDLSTVYGTEHDSEAIFLAQGHLAFMTGQLALAHKLFESVVKSSSRRANHQHEVWALNAQAASCIGMGKFEIATRLLNDSQKRLGADGEKISTIVCFGVLALARLRAGNLEGAKIAADSAWKRMDDVPTSFEVIYGYMGVVEVYLELWLRAILGRTKDAVDLGRKVKGAWDCINRYADLFPLGAPLVHLYEGRIGIYQGDSKNGRRCLEKGLALSREMQVPYFEGLVLYELVLCPAVLEAQTRKYFKTARELFWKIGSTYYAERLDAYSRAELAPRQSRKAP